MGQRFEMTKIRLSFVHEFRDRHGKVRRYVRLPGRKRVPLPGVPGSSEFMQAYEAALAGEAATVRQIGESRSKPGTIAALAAMYFSSAHFRGLSVSTQATYHGILDRFRCEHGDKRVATLAREHIVKMFAKKTDTPAAANNWLRMVRMLMQFAISEGIRRDDPTSGVRAIRVRTEGFYTWSEEDIAAFETRHSVGSRARLALALLLYTAQRRGDVVRMGRQHIRHGVLAIRQQKTGVTVEIPLHPELIAVLDASAPAHLTFLTTSSGEPFTPAGFTNWFRECCGQAGLPKGCSPHGLRKAASRRLAEHGCTPHEIMSITGHQTLKEVTRYTAAADRRGLAEKAVAKTLTRTGSGKP
jgi:integrase